MEILFLSLVVMEIVYSKFIKDFLTHRKTCDSSELPKETFHISVNSINKALDYDVRTHTDTRIVYKCIFVHSITRV